eukprot:600856-Amphidinium_carterae.1
MVLPSTEAGPPDLSTRLSCRQSCRFSYEKLYSPSTLPVSPTLKALQKSSVTHNTQMWSKFERCPEKPYQLCQYPQPVA